MATTEDPISLVEAAYRVAVDQGAWLNQLADGAADQEKAAMARELEQTLGLTLSEEKTLVTPVTSTMRFLGHNLRVRAFSERLVSRAVIPKERSKRLRQTIGAIFRGTTCHQTPESRLRPADC